MSDVQHKIPFNLEALRGMRVAVMGLGVRCGVSVTRFLCDHGANVLVSDRDPAEKLTDSLPQIEALPIELDLGGHTLEKILQSELVIVSPGVPWNLDVLVQARQRGMLVVGELEFASWYLDAPMIAVTGTNGKTTTAFLIQHILKSAGLPHFLGGNMGRPLIESFAGRHLHRYVVVEASSYQLEACHSFSPHIALLLNVQPDHLERHGNLLHYANAKANIFLHQKPNDYAVINVDSSRALAEAKKVRSRLVTFSAQKNAGHADFIIDETSIRSQLRDHVYSTETFQLPGAHNLENLAAAIAAAEAINVEPSAVQRAIDTAQPLPHRLEPIHSKSAFTFINDSKSTTIDSTLRALQSFSQPIVLIVGGQDKQFDYAPLYSALKANVRAVVGYGAAGKRIHEGLPEGMRAEFVGDFEHTIDAAMKFAKAGDAIMLSPAASSLDSFRDFEERGDAFRLLVENWHGGKRAQV